jgi:hypothetical protein
VAEVITETVTLEEAEAEEDLDPSLLIVYLDHL